MAIRVNRRQAEFYRQQSSTKTNYMRMVERGSTEWVKAWAALRSAGHDIDDYMLMHVDAYNRAHFKHVDTREYVIIRV